MRKWYLSQRQTAKSQARQMDRVKRIWYLSLLRAAKVQASLRNRAVSPEPPLLAHTSSESRGIFRQKARSLAPLNGWTCTVKICHDGMLEDTNSLDVAQMISGTGKKLRTMCHIPDVIELLCIMQRMYVWSNSNCTMLRSCFSWDCSNCSDFRIITAVLMGVRFFIYF